MLVLTNLFPNRADPTFAPFNRQQFARLAEHADVEVLGVVPWRLARRLTIAANGAIPAREVIDGISVEHPRFPTIPGLPALNAALIAGAVAPGLLRRRARGERWDVLLAAYAYPDGCAGVLLGEALGLPVVVKCHGSDLNRVPRARAARLQLEKLLPRAAAVVTVSKKLGARAERLGVSPERLRVVYNGVDRARVFPRDKVACRRALGLPEHREVVLFVGHLEDHKGALDLLAAAELLAARRPKSSVVYVGHGPEDVKIRRVAERPELDGLVRLVGAVSHAEVAEYMGAADVLCLPSWDEGMPNVVREAHASGRPVVATEVGGLPEAVHAPELGRLVPPRSPTQLAEALAAQLEAPSAPEVIVRLGLVATWDESAAALHAVLEEAAARS